MSVALQAADAMERQDLTSLFEDCPEEVRDALGLQLFEIAGALVMAARVEKAAALGCAELFTETGEAVAGEHQHSYGNILKYGFQEIGVREHFRPAH